MNQNRSANPIVLFGGSGVAGRNLARLLRARHPELPLLIVGRDAARARATAAEVGGAESLALPLTPKTNLAGLPRASAWVSLVNDPGDVVLRGALQTGAPYVDITRWTARLQQAIALIAAQGARAPIALSSAWMGGVAPLVAAWLAAENGGAEQIETTILYDLADQAGADAIEYMDRMWIPYEALSAGRRIAVLPLSDARRIRISGTRATAVRLDTPEQLTLPFALAGGERLQTVTTRIAFSSGVAMAGLRALAALGFFHHFRSDRFTKLRRALLQSNGAGGRAILSVEALSGERTARATVIDAAGQAHLTAIGALISLERTLGLDGFAPPAGLYFPEQHPDPARAIETLRACGAAIDLEIRAPQGREVA